MRRGLIVTAAQECIAEVGFAGTSARVVAARSGVSLGTVTYHFATMDELLVEALREASIQMTAAIVEAVDGESDAVAKLYRLIDSALPSSPAAVRNWKLWLEYWARATHVPELALLNNERYSQWREVVGSVISGGVASGEFAAVDVEEAAVSFVALQDGLGVQAAIGDPDVDLAVARRILRSWVESLRAPRSRARAPRARVKTT